MTKALFQKYLDGNCTEAERREVEAWLHACTAAGADGLLRSYWYEAHEPMPKEQAHALWAFLQTTIRPATATRTWIKAWYGKIAAVAAAIIVLAGACWLFVHKGHRMPQQQAAVPTPAPAPVTPAAPEWVLVENREATPKKICLQDGSEVLLYTNSRLRYLKHFEPGRRNLQLKGKGLFTVAKDKQRPFTVYSDEIATTALGTVFLVNTHAHQQYISVKLMEGKVMVRPVRSSHKDSVLLLPGQEAKYHIGARSLVVQMPAKIQRPNMVKEGDTLSFAHVPLYEVFEKLKQLHHVQIMYSKKEIAAMNFTGTIVRTDSLRVVLMAIARMNGLTIGEEEGAFTVLTAKQ